MARRMISFAHGESETDAVVRRWLTRMGIDQNWVRGYSIHRRESGDMATIELLMYFDDAPLPDPYSPEKWAPEEPASTEDVNNG